ncbi:unnamed protein product [Symbiodinium pilosum]|uniref:Uncharacterized protein n=1 Tax=Symbiodinium pilosum TaxID=2952 RepID=A0A812L274_SYMPI|nr:unnamed protein product [Symbiodinium pilosum]
MMLDCSRDTDAGAAWDERSPDARLPAAAVAESNEELISLLRQQRELLEPLPKMLKDQKWDNVRSVLKTPPVAYLWNLGMDKNNLKKLGDSLGEIQVLELMDEIASDLQTADEISYAVLADLSGTSCGVQQLCLWTTWRGQGENSGAHRVHEDGNVQTR